MPSTTPRAPGTLDWLVAAAAIVAIPCALFGVAVTLDQWLRLLWGGANVIGLAAGLVSIVGLTAFILGLRHYLRLAPAFPWLPQDALDFLALRRWPRSTVVAGVVLLLLPGLWWARAYAWILAMDWTPQWFFRSGDLHDALDTLAVVYQFILFAGLPILAGHFLLARHGRGGGWLAWLLLPFALLAVIVLFVVLHSIVHLMFM